MRTLGVHHMTAIETSPTEFVEAAAAADCQTISVFTYGDPARFPLLTAANKQAFQRSLAETDLRIINIDAFMILPDTSVDDFLPAVDLGAQLGARCVSTQVFDTEQQRVIETLGRLCDYSEHLGMTVSVEFMALSPAWNTLSSCVELIGSVGKCNLGISIDILHLIRSGAGPEEISTIAPELIAYAQLCDSDDLTAKSDYAREAMSGRLIPGEGSFPIQAFVQALPAQTPLELEVPNADGVPATQRIINAVAATRSLLEA